MSAPEPAEALTAVVRSVTDLWDEPLDEVHDVPQIVNAILAAGWTAQRADLTARLADPDVIARVVLLHNDTYEDAPLIRCLCGARHLTITEHASHVAAAVRDALTGGQT